MPAFKGLNVVIKSTREDDNTLKTLGAAESVTFEIATNIERFYEIGNARPYDIASGFQEVSGSLDRVLIDQEFFNNIVQPDGSIKYFNVYARLGTTGPYVYLLRCKAETVSGDISADGFVMESLDFLAEDWKAGQGITF